MSPAPKSSTTAALNARLNEAREDYRRAVGARQEAIELRHSLEPNNFDGNLAVHNANAQVELAAARFREALRDFVTALARN
jgi:hypothetical protein